MDTSDAVPSSSSSPAGAAAAAPAAPRAAPLGMPRLPDRPPKKVKPVAGQTPAAGAASPAGAPTAEAASTSSGTTSVVTTSAEKNSLPLKAGKSSFMPLLPPRQVVLASGPVLDPDEPEAISSVRKMVHSIRVSMIRAAQRLGYDHNDGLVKQVLYRLNLAEKLKAPWKRAGRRPDPAVAAAREASRLEQELGPSSPLDFTIKMMLIGLTGTGKTQLIQSLLDPGPAGADTQSKVQAIDPFEGKTNQVEVTRGTVYGIPLVCIDTPGLVSCASEAVANKKVLRQIRRAYQQQKPDLVLYVDRLDTSVHTSGELPVLQGISECLGPQVWLNTIVALTHGGSPAPCGAKGRLPFDIYASQRSHLVQQVIRHASGDGRIMSPTAFVESHPNCNRDDSGQPLLADGSQWKPHLFMMIISAKLLAATESLLQMQDDGSPGACDPGSKRYQRMMMAQLMQAEGARTLPLPYLTSAATQSSRPVSYPKHDHTMQVRQLLATAKASVNPKRSQVKLKKSKKSKKLKKEPIQLSFEDQRQLQDTVVRELMHLRQLARQDQDLATTNRKLLTGGKLINDTPNIAIKRAPSVNPHYGFRYRVFEAGNGWLVRPNVEPHGMDNTDGIEGLVIERTGVFHGFGGRHSKSRMGRMRLIGGMPYSHSMSADIKKDRRAVQARSVATIYHDLRGNVASTLSMDAQSSSAGALGVGDMLCSVRCETLRKGVLFEGNEVTMGMLLSRLAEDGWLLRGPVAAGLRLQDSLVGNLGPLPMRVDASTAYMSTVPLISNMGSMGETELEGSFGTNIEGIVDLQKILGTKESFPVTLNANSVSYKGTAVRGLAAALQTKLTGGDVLAVRVQANNKNRAVLNLKFMSNRSYMSGVVVMLWPLGVTMLQKIGVLK